MNDPFGVHEKFLALLGDTSKTAMTQWSPSAAYGFLLLRWQGVNDQKRELRVNPRGLDLETVLAEFAEQCRQAAGP